MRGRKFNYKDYHKEINGVLYKRCTRHNEFFPDESEWIPCTNEYFYINDKNKSDGLHPECKKCTTRKMQKYRNDNEEWYKEYNKKYYKEKKEYLNAIYKDWYDKNKEYTQNWMKEWRKTEHGKSIANMHSHNRQQNKTHKISKIEYESCKDYFDYTCAYCGMPEEYHKELFNQQLHKDHADPNGSNMLDNCIPACKICNSEKHDTPWDEWYTPDNEHYEEDKYNRILKWLSNDFKKYIKIRSK